MLKYLLYSVVILLFSKIVQAQERVDITTCAGSGTGIVCVAPSDSIYRLCVKVRAGTCGGDTYEIDWDDGKLEQIVVKDSITITHDYDLRSFIKNCSNGQYRVDIFAENTTCANNNKGFRVTFNKKPEAKPVIQAACEGTSVSIQNNSCPSSDIDFKWEFSDGRSSTAYTPSLAFTDPNQTYKVKLIATSPTCGSDTKEVDFKLKKLPVADYKVSGTTIVNQDTVVCSGGLLTLDGTISQDETRYFWQITGGNYNFQNNTNSGSSIISIKLNEVKEYTITLSASNECGTKKIVRKIKVLDLPTLKLTPQDNVCEPIIYKINAPVAGATYTVNGQVVDPSKELSFGFDPKPYIISAKLTNACGTQTVADTFTVAAAQQVKIISLPKDTTICVSNVALPLLANILGGTWSTQGVQQQNGKTVFVPATSGNYTITYSNGVGKCLTRDTVRVKVDGVQATATNTTICEGTAFVKLVGTPAAGKWTTSDCVNCIKGDTLLASGLTVNQLTVIYEVANQTGCKATATAKVTIGNPKAAFDVTGGCTGSAFKPVNNSSGAGTYIWKVNNIQVSTEPNPALTLASGVQNITLIAKSGDCADTLQKQITIVAPPGAVSFTPSGTLGCAPFNTTFQLNGTPDPNSEYTWDFGNTSTFTGTQPPAQKYENPDKVNRTYTITLVSKNACGEKKFTQDVVVRPTTQAEIGVDSTVLRCTPAEMLFSNRSVGHDKDLSRWIFGDGEIKQTGNNTVTHTFVAKDSAMVYRVKLEVTGGCGPDTAEIAITVYPTTVKALYAISKSIVCPGETVQFTDATVPKPNRWTWKFGDGTTSTIANPTHKFAKEQSEYKVTLIAYTDCGYDSTQLTVKTTTLPSGSFDDVPIACERSEVQFINKSDTQLGFIWDFGDGSGLDSTSYSPSHAYTTAGNYEALLYAYRGTQACKVLLKKSNVTVTSSAEANFGFEGDSLFCAPGPVSLINLSKNADTFQWVFSDGRTSEVKNPTLPFEQGIYSVKLIASKGGFCKDSAERAAAFVVQHCQVDIPDAFTPNGDATGEKYTLFGDGVLKIKSLRIRNRWGEIVFDAKDIPAGSQKSGEAWDGTFGGQPAPADMYVYEAEVIYVDNRLSGKLRGNIYLVR